MPPSLIPWMHFTPLSDSPPSWPLSVRTQSYPLVFPVAPVVAAVAWQWVVPVCYWPVLAASWPAVVGSSASPGRTCPRHPAAVWPAPATGTRRLPGCSASPAPPLSQAPTPAINRHTIGLWMKRKSLSFICCCMDTLGCGHSVMPFFFRFFFFHFALF